MNFINRAVTNVRRNLSRTALLLITFFVIGNFVILGLAVSKASDNAKVETRKQMKAVVSLDVDFDKYYEDGSELPIDEQDQFYQDNQPRLNFDMVNELAKDDRVVTVDTQNMTIAYSSSDIDVVKLGNEQDNQDNSYCYTDENGNEICESYASPDLAVVGNLYPSMINIEDKTYEIISGEFYSEEDLDNRNHVMLVTEEFALLNNLNVGDAFKIYFDDPSNLGNENINDDITEDDISLDMEIIGIFRNNKVLDKNSNDYKYKQSYEAPGNMILVPATTLEYFNYERGLKQWEYAKEKYATEEYYQDDNNKPVLEDYQNIQSAVFLLNDPLQVDEFVSDYQANLDKYIKLDANNEMFIKLSKPLDTMSMFANFIVWLVIINAIIIISLVTALTLKNREYEIGCLLSLGASRFKIITQFFIELSIIAIIGFSLSIISASFLSNKVGESVWKAQSTYDGIVELEDNNNEYDDSFWNPSSAHVTEINYQDINDNYQARVSTSIIVQIYIAGLIIVLLAILIPSLMIMRFSPKKILMSSQ